MSELPHTRADVAAKSRALSSVVKGGLGLMATALADMVAAYSTGYWATWSRAEGGTVYYGGYGLWKMWRCSAEDTAQSHEELHRSISDTQCVVRLADSGFPGWYVTCQVLQTLGLAAMLASFILLLLYVFLPQCNRNKTAMATLTGLSYLAGLLIVVGLCVFGFKVAEEIEELRATEWFLSWSFSLACTAFVLNQVAASILVTENKRLHQGNQAPPGKDEGKPMLIRPT